MSRAINDAALPAELAAQIAELQEQLQNAQEAISAISGRRAAVTAQLISAMPSTAGNTRRFIAALEPFVPVEAVGPFRYRTQTIAHDPSLFTGAEKRILDLVSRRPATVADLEVALNRPGSEINPILEKLFKSGLVEIEKQQRGTFYSAPHYKK